ncbi:uncharacterized protein LOC101457237 [Ceratitis capitata]|uniref:uncharacterized protein LOC101457237 n=1 Tax=Ceratitis capitata TaxID=7213 RepID=UPI00032A11A0|nr:uncharacterized protein LOC101457237 [Ceratitis capitata]
MLRLKIPRTKINCCFQVYRNFLSNEYKSALNDFDVHSIEVNDLRSKDTAAGGIILLDVVNGFAHDNRNNEFSETLLRLRSQPEKSLSFEATNYAIFRTFIDNGNVDELVPLIKNRLQTGIFVDNFMGCYLLNYLLQAKNYLGAAEVGLEIFKQDSLDNKLVVGLVLKAFFEYLKENVEQIAAPVVKEKKPAKKSDEVKIRVKFLRNPDDIVEFPREIGRSMCRISELQPNQLTANLRLLGSLLDNRQTFAASLLDNKDTRFCKDTLELSQTLLKNKEGVDEKLTNSILHRLEEVADSKTIDVLLSSYVKEAKAEETNLIKQQAEKYVIWKEQDDLLRKTNVDVIPPSQRKENIDKILADLLQKKQKLWYFENEELIDLEIFKKDKRYPKRWFGKKKKPRVVDDNYVPPEITRKHGKE